MNAATEQLHALRALAGFTGDANGALHFLATVENAFTQPEKAITKASAGLDPEGKVFFIPGKAFSRYKKAFIKARKGFARREKDFTKTGEGLVITSNVFLDTEKAFRRARKAFSSLGKDACRVTKGGYWTGPNSFLPRPG